MTNEEKAQQIIGCNRANCLECGGSLSVANGCVEFERIMAMADFKDTQTISELGGWQTEPPTKDCTVLLYITEQTLTVSRWNSPNKMFYDEYLEPIKHWLKWKLI